MESPNAGWRPDWVLLRSLEILWKKSGDLVAA